MSKRVACFHPQSVYRARGGGITYNAAASISGIPITVPCGQCIGCRLERSRQWAIRMMHEASLHPSNIFVTLTYSDDNLPHDYSVDVRHWQLFAKRFRKKCGAFRFYHCGEYGEQTLRPHYHAIVFGKDFADKKALKKNHRGECIYSSETLAQLWPYGHSSIGAVTFESAAYVARYCMKKITGKPAQQYYERVHPITGEIVQVQPEYSTMSRRPGIGQGWLQKYKSDAYPSDYIIQRGVKMRPPKYYDKQLPEQELEALQARRKQSMHKHKWNNTKERLAVREQVTTAKVNTLKRNLGG